MPNGLPVFSLPMGQTDINFAYHPVYFLTTGDSQPLHTVWCLNTVSIPPPFFGKLDIVVKHKDIRQLNLVEITFPGDVTGLYNGYGLFLIH